MHVFDDAQPVLKGGLGRPPSASLEQYATLQRRLGTSRFVNVTPSIYGTSNDVLVASLRAAGARARGVAVVNDAVADRTLHDLHLAGVRGARFNLVQSGTTTAEMLWPVAEKIRHLGWHVQLHARPSHLLSLRGEVEKLPVPVVLDHIACLGEDEMLQSAVEECLKDLLRTGKVWLKLSAPYFSARTDAAYERLSIAIEGLIGDFAGRLLWGSDWPHGTEADKPDDAKMIDFLLASASDDQVRSILVQNPSLIYDFKG